ncbi:GGDEF domain-containing protein [Blautia sp. HCP3S3_H10_1]|uniref:GGDEF domain-containing protein n=1 Tax=unclassified Blautia TaxID=2648079 RepID=UPI003F929F7F
MLEKITFFKKIFDTVWEYHKDSNQLYVHYDSALPEYCNTRVLYDEMYKLYTEEYVYKEDLAVWERYMSSENLNKFLQGDKEEGDFEFRMEHTRIGLEWHAAYMNKLDDNRILIAIRDIKDEQRNASIAHAVLPEFDYVCRIDVETQGYILYYSADEKTVVPQHSAGNFEQSIGAFNLEYIVPEEAEALNENMRLNNIKARLEEQDEYILYATSRDKNGLTYKKFRFCYADASKHEILLTRTDVSDVVKERMLRQEEEKKRVAYLEKELYLTQELQKSQLEMQRILETTTDLMFKYDPENGAVLLHKAEEEDYHPFLSEEDMLRKLAEKGYLEEQYVETLEECIEQIRNGEHRLSCTIKARKNLTQDWVWYKVTLFDYQDEATHERKVLGYLQNINLDMSDRERLEKAAQRDSLTGLYNMGTAKKKICEILRNQTKDQQICNAFFLMDVDDFKSINDTNGHMTGDDTLKKFASVLNDTFRFQDIIYRLGGDEFAVFAEDLHDSSTCIEAIMERFKEQIGEAQKDFPFLSISVGVYVTDRRHTYEQYYEEADKALYETKKNGKNAYTVRKDVGR